MGRAFISIPVSLVPIVCLPHCLLPLKTQGSGQRLTTAVKRLSGHRMYLQRRARLHRFVRSQTYVSKNDKGHPVARVPLADIARALLARALYFLFLFAEPVDS